MAACNKTLDPLGLIEACTTEFHPVCRTWLQDQQKVHWKQGCKDHHLRDVAAEHVATQNKWKQASQTNVTTAHHSGVKSLLPALILHFDGCLHPKVQPWNTLYPASLKLAWTTLFSLADNIQTSSSTAPAPALGRSLVVNGSAPQRDDFRNGSAPQKADFRNVECVTDVHGHELPQALPSLKWQSPELQPDSGKIVEEAQLFEKALGYQWRFRPQDCLHVDVHLFEAAHRTKNWTRNLDKAREPLWTSQCRSHVSLERWQQTGPHALQFSRWAVMQRPQEWTWRQHRGISAAVGLKLTLLAACI